MEFSPEPSGNHGGNGISGSGAVRYRSSRDGISPGNGEGPPRTVSFRQALLRGLAPDGGLYLPERIPPLPSGWERMPDLPRLAAAVLGGWLEEPSGPELAGLLTDALDFPVPLVPLSDDRFVVELFHGPTLSFKDFGARTMARLMNRYLAGSSERLTILVATSGDTGSAVADGFAGLDNLQVVLLYPKGMVSEVQELQLTARRPGLRTLAVNGTFDDCQRLVKAAFDDPGLEDLPLSSANSINIGRLLPQQLYYIWAVAQLERILPTAADPLVSVPSGNLGNLTAGMLAAAAGLPVAGFLAAHNANDYFPRYLAGSAPPFEFGSTVATLSNAMDVGAPSNFERLHQLFPGRLKDRVTGVSVDDAATRSRMRRTFEEEEYVVCPHTAVGLEAVDRRRAATGDDRPALILATAHPAKFPRLVEESLGRPVPPEPRLARLRELSGSTEEIPASGAALRDVLLSSS